jgi:membrane associated rhomboid family serine protease
VSEPDLFVVCKNCSSEVSPYVTECPYCGQRVRKRAPKIDRKGSDEEPEKRRRVRPPRLSPLKRGEIPGIAPETRPYATIAVIVISLAATLVVVTGRVSTLDLGGVFGSLGTDYWRLVTTPFVYFTAGTTGAFYEFVTLIAIGIFGTLVERRFGSVVMILIFLAAGAGGAALAIAMDSVPALGGNGAALGLLAAWLVDDRLSAKRGAERGNDLIGVAVFAAVLLLMPLAATQASAFAGLGGVAVGTVAGTLMSPFRP